MKTLFLSIIISVTYFLLSVPYGDYVTKETEKVIAVEPVRLEYNAPTLEPLFSEEEVMCLQENIFFEARNQSEDARIAVAWVTFNRVKDHRYKNTVCGVVKRGVHINGIPVKNKCAFSWYCDKLSDNPSDNKIELNAWEEARELAYYMLNHCFIEQETNCPEDQTGGAIFYFNPRLADPAWKMTKVKTTSIGDHDFYRYAD